MDVLFYLVPCLIMALVLFGAYRVLRRSLQIRSAWNSGLTAEARCLRMFTTTHGGGHDTSVSTTLHHVFEFTARDGRLVRFEEENGPATILEGDFVTVYYAEGREVIATAKAPRRAGLAASTIAILTFLGVIVVFCVAFMVTFSQMSDEFGFGEGTDDTTNTVVVDGVTITP
ncbi:MULTISPECIES: hypothetical protein [unclassified Streptomyces]|uniref:hypothetical protein n=1 Tax=unclassified Streptomyces TaxID=2593676 RepID=UPI002251676B|nr:MULTISPECIES: hypothetical protein [unclassified Streptomyces]MCX5048428.1 hypothetical protein [Streptomyces sp. NBC_00474]MCX5056838.1 hypothetical protein [Streptomyces sp. NBC_00452]MCX5246245.1 hypothetical protein [Streptomyces sp. NBC_00201]MCX5287930.1 hypothetical protein [Streptomyces sp. NBC_00183]